MEFCIYWVLMIKADDERERMRSKEDQCIEKF